MSNQRNSNIISRFLDSNGDGTGDVEAATNAVALTNYSIMPPSGTTYVINRMIVSVQDDGGMIATEYGNLNSALSNGIFVRTSVAGDTNYQLTSPALPVTVNAHWGSYCYDVDIKGWGNGDDLLLARWTFTRSGRPIVLDGEQGDSFDVLLNDNFADLSMQRFLVQGYHIATETRGSHRHFDTPRYPEA